ncbi:hypothetical protein O3M35_007209 [Rhynocoris fuscipes]|uniref:Uncharacterized protein n=1 Tax=Rhynocoris fuscipes TaxID=488301 RepID=A0AAW1DFZ6_9HEMI
MQLFAFGTTSRCADYIKISSQSDQQCCQRLKPFLRYDVHKIPNFYLFCIHYCILYYILLYIIYYYILFFRRNLLNRDATSPEATNTFSVLIRSFLNVLICNFIFSNSLPRLFRHTNFKLIKLSGQPLYLKPLLHFHENFLIFLC